eukprot:1157328-Pelagomonas_calceolata.AAC.8
MAESQFRTGSPRERAPPRGTVSAPQVQSCPSQQLNILSYKTVGQPSDYAPVAGASLSRLMEGQPAKNVRNLNNTCKHHGVHSYLPAMQALLVSTNQLRAIFFHTSPE